VTTATSSTDVRESETGPEPAVRLTLSCEPAVDGDGAPGSASVFSSIKQTAVALANVASQQAVSRASRRPAAALPEIGNSRAELAVQRANAEQARRVADRARLTVEAVIRHTIQPCLALDDAGCVIRWNPAMAAWTGVDEASALARPLSALFATDASVKIEAASAALREAEDAPGGVDADPVSTVEGPFATRNGVGAAKVSLLPLCRLPHVVEAVIVLVTPSPEV
jgi:PAS domain-containing protein